MLLENVKGVFLTYQDVTRRFTELVITRAFDDKEEGGANADALQQAIVDAEATVLPYAAKHYEAQCSGPAETAHPTLKKLTLDAFTLLIYERAPKLIPLTATTAEERRKTLDAQLKNLSMNVTVLHGAVPVATNVGGDVWTNDPNDPCPRPHVFLNGFGDF